MQFLFKNRQRKSVQGRHPKVTDGRLVSSRPSAPRLDEIDDADLTFELPVSISTLSTTSLTP
jgi:hypothetical protein